MGSGSRDVDAWHANGQYAEDRGLQVPMALKHGPVTSSGKSAPGPDPRIRHRIQIGMFRPIRVDHTNCLQVAIKTHSFNDIISFKLIGTIHGGAFPRMGKRLGRLQKEPYLQEVDGQAY